MKRVILDVVFSDGSWCVKARGGMKTWETYNHKDIAVECAAWLCTYLASFGQRSQVVIHRKDGQIQSERTYGDDPKSRKG